MFGRKELFGGYVRRWVLDKLRAMSLSREPDVFIGGRDSPYLLRWYVIPRNRFFNVYFHTFLRSDYAEALHDHPWLFNASWLMAGDYNEHVFTKPPRGWKAEGNPPTKKLLRERGDMAFRLGRAPHRVELMPEYRNDYEGVRYKAGEHPVETLFITGPRVRSWGFYCARGWKKWKDFLGKYDNAHEGLGVKGCD